MMRLFPLALVVIATLTVSSCETTGPTGPTGPGSSPVFGYPPAAWDVRPEGRQWTTLTHNAIDTLAPELVSIVPADIDAFCPGYRNATPANRRAFSRLCCRDRRAGLRGNVAGLQADARSDRR